MKNKLIRKDKRKGISPLIAIILMIAITIVLTGVLNANITNMSPEIYIYAREPVITDVTIEIENGVTKTVPEIPLGNKVTWKDVYVGPDGNIIFNGEKYPYLYYEGRFEYPQSDFGWVIERIDDDLFLNNNQITIFELQLFLKEEFKKSGLYDHEISDIIQRIEDNNMLEFSSNYLIINYIPLKDVNEVIQIKTSFEFSIMRRHFLIQESNELVDLKTPVYEIIKDDGFLIHETAINRI